MNLYERKFYESDIPSIERSLKSIAESAKKLADAMNKHNDCFAPIQYEAQSTNTTNPKANDKRNISK